MSETTTITIGIVGFGVVSFLWGYLIGKTGERQKANKRFLEDWEAIHKREEDACQLKGGEIEEVI